MAGLFQVLYAQSDGKFRKAEVLNGTDGQPLIIPGGEQSVDKICTRPFAVDWDGDGHLDLVVGNFGGTFFWFRGEGPGKFQPKPEPITTGGNPPITTGGNPLRIEGQHSDPFAIDWDGDGDLDLLSGSSRGGVQWSENVAGKGKLPQMRPFQSLIDPGPPINEGALLSEADLTGPTTLTRISVADVNGDGKLDLLVGDCVTLFSPKAGLTPEEFRKKHEVWSKAFEKASRAYTALPESAEDANAMKIRETYYEVYQQRAEFMTEERTGFVWLYLHN